MIAKLVGAVVGLGVPAKLARPVLGALIFLLVIGVLLIGKCSYDRSIISNHDAKQTAANAIADRKADNNAAVQRDTDLARQQYEQDQLTQAVDNAPKDPNIPDARERDLAFHRCLRLQQAARSNGLKPPACV